MNSGSPQRVRGVLALLLMLMVTTCSATTAWSYIGIGWIRNQVDGDFDDDTVLIGADAIYDVPTIDPGDGLRFVLGGGSDKVSGELSYALTHHRAPGALRPDGYPTKLHYASIDLLIGTGLGKSLTSGRGQFYVRVGITAARLRLDGGAYDLSATPFDVEYQGGGFTFGSGFELRFPAGVRPYVEYDYRLVSYGSVLAPRDNIEIEDSVSGRGPSICAGINFALPRRNR
ncbi:MAG: hypothetical protein HOP12_11620 [Candidatus Eisenbacteria bacterium]|uniref:Porin family protein n=1 Tax=Eiseniibacteriota bacterium TaxID=2212470 RepID=A0A849SQ92_UNCEI|nr:hypothetical protein [Candidatus Eisenbacteria bacterium]